MTAFLAEVGRRLAERWFNSLVLPGVLWLAVATAGVRLGQSHPFGVGRLRAWVDQVAAQPGSHAAGTVLLVAAGALAFSAAAGLAAAALGGTVQRLWVLPGGNPPLAWLTAARQLRWDRLTAALRAAIAQAAFPDAHHVDPARAATRVETIGHRRAAIGDRRPTRPTWIADRLRATTTRAQQRYGLDLTPAWPRLWTLLPETMRDDLAAAQEAYAGAARLTAWGVLVGALVVVWWPAAPVGAAILVAGRSRARSATAVLTDLVDTAVDLYTPELATRLGLPATGTPGRSVTAYLRNG